MLPIVLITGVSTNCTAVLNTLDRFALPALAPAVISISVVAGALILGARFGIWAMVYATLAGSLLHAIIVGAMMHTHGYRFQLRWYGMTKATRRVAGQYGPILLSSVVASGGLLVDQSMAAMLPSGSVSALVYANRFVSVVLSLLAGAISTAIVPIPLALDRPSRLVRMPPHSSHLGAPYRAYLRSHRGSSHCRRSPFGSCRA